MSRDCLWPTINRGALPKYIRKDLENDQVKQDWVGILAKNNIDLLFSSVFVWYPNYLFQTLSSCASMNNEHNDT